MLEKERETEGHGSIRGKMAFEFEKALIYGQGSYSVHRIIMSNESVMVLHIKR